MRACVSASLEIYPPMGASGSAVQQNCPSNSPLSPRNAFAIGTISLFAGFYQLVNCAVTSPLRLFSHLQKGRNHLRREAVRSRNDMSTVPVTEI